MTPKYRIGEDEHHGDRGRLLKAGQNELPVCIRTPRSAALVGNDDERDER